MSYEYDIQFDLLRQARDGHAIAVKKLLAAGANPNHPSYFKDMNFCQTPLGEASRAGSSDMVRALLDAGADVHAKMQQDVTALHMAARVETIQLLLEAGASIDQQDRHGRTALMRAASGGKIDAVKALLEAGADLDIRAHDGGSALMFAVSRLNSDNHVELVQTLLEADADPQGEMFYSVPYFDGGYGPSDEESKEIGARHLKIKQLVEDHTVRAMVEGRINIDTQDEYGNTMLINMSENGKLDHMKALLNAGADASIVNRKGETAEDQAEGEAKSILVAHRERLQLRRAVGVDEQTREPPKQRRKM